MSDSAMNLSSITKKVWMAVFGLFLGVFLLVHLGVNLLMLAGDGGKLFSEAANFMGTNIFIKVFEYVLFGGFFIHMIFGVIVWMNNRIARPVRYYKCSKSETHFLSKYMFHTGVIVFVFLILHFMSFYFVKIGLVQAPAGVADNHDFFNMAILLFDCKLFSILYIISFIILGFHLNHAIQSGFQTVGFNHDKYTPAIKMISSLYSILIAVGFSVIPLYFMFCL